MTDGAMPKPLQDLAGAFMAVMVVGGILIAWLTNRGRPRRGEGGSDDGSSSDDGPHRHGWWGSDDADGGHQGDGGTDGH